MRPCEVPGTMLLNAVPAAPCHACVCARSSWPAPPTAPATGHAPSTVGRSSAARSRGLHTWHWRSCSSGWVEMMLREPGCITGVQTRSVVTGVCGGRRGRRWAGGTAGHSVTAIRSASIMPNLLLRPTLVLNAASSCLSAGIATSHCAACQSHTWHPVPVPALPVRFLPRAGHVHDSLTRYAVSPRSTRAPRAGWVRC